MKENANKLHFNRLQLCEWFPKLIANKIFQFILFCYFFSFAINLWHQKFVTANVTAVSVNSQHGIQQQGQDFDKNFICNQYEERVAIETTKISKFVDE